MGAEGFGTTWRPVEEEAFLRRYAEALDEIGMLNSVRLGIGVPRDIYYSHEEGLPEHVSMLS